MSKKKKYWTIAQALEEADRIGIEISKPTLIKWCKTKALGFQLGDVGGKWYIYPHKYMRYLNGGKTETGKNPNIIVVSADERQSQE